MSEWQDMRQKPNTKLRDSLQNKKAKTHKLSELSKTEQNRLAKLNGMLDELRRGENVQNRRLGTWLTEAEYEGFKSDVGSQQQIREELNDKPDELKRYEDKLKKAIFNYSRAEGYSAKGKNSTAKKFYNSSESLCEDALEILQEIVAADADTKWAALELMLASSASVVALAKKMTKPETKTVTRTIPIPKTKVIKQPVQQTSKPTANDAARTAIKPITPQKLLPNQQIS